MIGGVNNMIICVNLPFIFCHFLDGLSSSKRGRMLRHENLTLSFDDETPIVLTCVTGYKAFTRPIRRSTRVFEAQLRQKNWLLTMKTCTPKIQCKVSLENCQRTSHTHITFILISNDKTPNMKVVHFVFLRVFHVLTIS